MRVLLVGVGFLGAHVAAALRAAGHEVSAGDLDARAAAAALGRLDVAVPVESVDVADYVAVAALVHAARPDAIVNTAAIVSSRVQKPALMARVNMLGVVHLLEAARLFAVPRVVQTSSTIVYGAVPETAEGRPIAETSPVTLPLSYYGITKQAAEGMGHTYARQYGVGFVALRFPHIFGGGSVSKGRAIEHLVECAVAGRPARVDDSRLSWQGGEAFIYAKDAARALVRACEAPAIPEGAINIAMPRPYSFDEVVALARTHLDRDLAVEYAPGYEPPATTTPDGPLYDGTRAREQLGFTPGFDMPAAMLDYAEALRREPGRG
jgi:UDP-glucose 4-epimerase